MQVNQGALDDLLDTRQYTTEMVCSISLHLVFNIKYSPSNHSWLDWIGLTGYQVLERKEISGMTEVPGVAKMTRVLFR